MCPPICLLLIHVSSQPAGWGSELGKIFENSQIIFENEDTCLKANLHVREDLPALGWLDVESAADLEEVQTVSERDWSDKRYIAMVMCG